MKWFIKEIFHLTENVNTAYTKAQYDIDEILRQMGYAPLEIKDVPNAQRTNSKGFLKYQEHLQQLKLWNEGLKQTKSGDVVVIQFPPKNHTLFLNQAINKCRKKGVRFIAIIHDLESIRAAVQTQTPFLRKLRNHIEEVSVMNMFDRLVVHNSCMKQLVKEKYGFSDEKIVCLQIFDYLIPSELNRQISKQFRSCIIAGNLNREKVGYLSQLPQNVQFELYGPGFCDCGNDNVHYHGVFPADELPTVLQGGFGLVWDGPSAETCTGVNGEYLRYNNPHKTSLYLACGIPVIIWKEAALAPFIEENNCGFTVKSLSEIYEKLERMDAHKYQLMCEAAKSIGDKIRKGYFSTEAIKKSE